MSDISIIVAGVGEISGSVLYAGTSFQAQMGGVPGTATVVVKDPNQTLTFVSGQKIDVTIDGIPLWGGYIMQPQRKFAFPVVDTTVLSAVKGRQWVLNCVDNNILFDKRVIRDPSNFLQSPTFETSRSMGDLLTNLLCADLLDIPSGLDVSTHVDSTGYMYRDGTGANVAGPSGHFGAWQQGGYWRQAMTDMAGYGALYYIDAGFALHLHAVEETLMPWGFSDKPNRFALPSIPLATYPMRECFETDDAAGMVNDAFVWGGSQWAGASGGTVFGRSTNSGSITAHNLWQYPELKFGDANYASQGEVSGRADLIVNGMPGTDIGVARGLSNIQKQYECVWFAHDVPSISGVKQHVRPGYVMPMALYTFGSGGSPLMLNLPLRSVRIDFPTLDPSGNPYVKFTGQFGLQMSDPSWLWAFILGLRNGPQAAAISFTDGSSTSAQPGSYASFDYTPTAGQTVFTTPFTYYLGSTTVYLNGLVQRSGIDYTETNSSTVTFSEGLVVTDNLVIECRTT